MVPDSLGQQVFAVVDDVETSPTTGTVDAYLVRQTSANEAVGEQTVVETTIAHALHVVAVGAGLDA